MDYLDLHWLPVGAGTHFQRTSLLLYESLVAALARRPRAVLCHAGLKIGLHGRTYTLELTPVPRNLDQPPILTGAVGSSLAGRARLFRYQLSINECPTLPDEEWTVGGPVHLVTDPRVMARIFDLAATVPPHVWGRRTPGTSEMWTSNSAVSWLLTNAGVDATAIPLPAGTRAPGWQAGIEAAHAPPVPRAGAGAPARAGESSH